MTIKQQVLDKANTPQGRIRLAMALGVTEQAVIKAMRKNAEHGPLTRYAALEVLASISGLDMPEIVEVKKLTANA